MVCPAQAGLLACDAALEPPSLFVLKFQVAHLRFGVGVGF